MRTTIDINDELLTAAKARAVSQGKSLQAVIEEALRNALSNAHSQRNKKSLKVSSLRGDGLQPGVDFLDNAALEELMRVDADVIGGPDSQIR